MWRIARTRLGCHVTCRDLRDELVKGSEPSESALAHASTCAACAVVVGDRSRLGHILAREVAGRAHLDSKSLFMTVASKVAGETGLRAYLRSRPTWQRRALAFLSSLPLPFLVLAVAGARRDLHSLSPFQLAFEILLLGGLAAWNVTVALKPLHVAGRPRSRTILVAAAASVVGIASLLLLAADPSSAGAGMSAPGEAESRCFATGSAIALPLMLCGWLLSRESSLPRALLLASAAGLSGMLVLHMHCPSRGCKPFSLRARVGRCRVPGSSSFSCPGSITRCLRAGQRVNVGKVCFSFRQVFGWTIAGLALLLGLLLTLLIQGSRRAILEGTQRTFEAAAREIEERVAQDLKGAEDAIRDFEAEVRTGILHADDPLAVESALFATLLRHSDLAEATLTYGSMLGYGPDGTVRLAETGQGQVSLERSRRGDPIGPTTRHIHLVNGRFVVDVRKRASGWGLLDAPLQRLDGPPLDSPTRHLTFQTPASAQFRGRLLWSDLHPSQLDANLPENERRVVVTAQKAIEARDGRFVGVLRVSLTTDRLEQITQTRIAPGDRPDPHRIFLCDPERRLISPSPRRAQLEETPSGYRVRSEDVPADVALALAHPRLAELAAADPPRLIRLSGDGTDFLLTFRALRETQDWVIGILVPEDYYLGELAAMRSRLLVASFALMVVTLVGGAATAGGLGKSLAQIVDEAGELRNFRFAARHRTSRLREVHAVLESVERAKTALRALGKYVPVDLVRLLYEDGREPRLGAELRDVSIMFSDVKDFTTLAEALSPNELASFMGRYFEVMTGAVHISKGIIDKYIGDAVMALWNVPSSTPGHPLLACQAALACREAEQGFQVPAGLGRPRIATRFGIHRDSVMVGHFGAPDRMSYTAMGDGVNLASRLEGLNKHYGTSIIVSESVYDAAKDAFEFRFLDRVAVKGRTKGVQIYELRGPKGAVDPIVERYERALVAYLGRDFSGAAELLGTQLGDDPSRALHEKCTVLLRNPPPEDWGGVFVFSVK